MKAPNALWSSIFLIVVTAAEYFFGHDVVATQGAAIAWILSVILRMWQEREASTVHTMSRGTNAHGYWYRVVLG